MNLKREDKFKSFKMMITQKWKEGFIKNFKMKYDAKNSKWKKTLLMYRYNP